MDQFAARLIKPIAQYDWRDKSGRAGPAEGQAMPQALSSPPTVPPRRSARVLSLLLTLEALRGAPDVFDIRR